MLDQPENVRTAPRDHLVPAEDLLPARLIERMQLSERLEIVGCTRERLLERVDLRGGQVPRTLVERAAVPFPAPALGDLQDPAATPTAAAPDGRRPRSESPQRTSQTRPPCARAMPRGPSRPAAHDRSVASRPVPSAPIPCHATRAPRARTVSAMSSKHSGVPPPISHGIHGGFVGGILGRRRQRAFEPPRQRMEPEDAAVQMRDESDERIAAPDMRELVREHARNFSAGHSVQPVGRMMVGARTPTVTGVATTVIPAQVRHSKTPPGARGASGARLPTIPRSTAAGA